METTTLKHIKTDYHIIHRKVSDALGERVKKIRVVNGIEIPYNLTPARVRIGIMNYNKLKETYESRLANNDFDNSGKGSKTYYVNSLAEYVTWIEKYGWLKDIYLSNKNNR
jgi:hypothetical protein